MGLENQNMTKQPIERLIDAKIAAIPPGSGGSGYLPLVLGTYDNNADAVAAIGVGKMYMSSTLINGSPIILITV